MNINNYNASQFQPAYAGNLNGYSFNMKKGTMSSTLLTAETKSEISKISEKIRNLLKV